MKFIGITGKKRSGKDKSSMILKEHLGYETIAFADAIKDAMIGLPLRGVNVRHRELYIPDGKEDHRDLDLKINITDIFKYVELVINRLGLSAKINSDEIYKTLEQYPFFSFRKLMQIIGTDLIHPINELFWVEKTFKKALQFDTKGVILTDIRFKHEANYVKSYGGIIIDIKRDVETTDDHISENGIIEYDIQIDNNGTLKELEEQLCQLKF